jgi:lipoyl(octanoyl) transferase
MHVSSTIISQKLLRVEEIGVIDYLTAWQIQREIHEKVVNNMEPNTLLILQHPSVYTAGRRTEISDRP